MAGTTLLQQLHEKAAELLAEGLPEIVQACRRALQALATVEAACGWIPRSRPKTDAAASTSWTNCCVSSSRWPARPR
jgi:hypothetical protein